MIVILFLSPQKSVLLHHTTIHVHGTCQYGRPASFLSLSWKGLSLHYEKHWKTWKISISYPCSLNSGITNFFLKHMPYHGSYPSWVTINISPLKYLPVWSRKQFRSWPIGSLVTNGSPFDSPFLRHWGEGGESQYQRQLLSFLRLRRRKKDSRWQPNK